MPRQKVTDSLSDGARQVMLQAFAQYRTAAFIAQAIQDATGEEVAPRTIARRAAEWRAEVNRRTAAKERMEDLVGAMKGGNLDAADMIQALAMDHLTYDPDALGEESPVRVQRLALAARETQLKERKLALQERSVSVDERKMHLLEEREGRLRAALEGDGKAEMTPEDRLREVRSILGLREPEAPRAA